MVIAGNTTTSGPPLQCSSEGKASGYNMAKYGDKKLMTIAVLTVVGGQSQKYTLSIDSSILGKKIALNENCYS